LHETEYALDGVFAYKSSHLLSWAEERSYGRFMADDGVEISLDDLRESAGDAVAVELVRLSKREIPAVCVPDVETLHDLELVAAGLRAAILRGAEVMVRCGPAFAGVASSTIARHYAEPPSAPDGLLVICGSYVSTTREQLRGVATRWPRAIIEADVSALVSRSPAGRFIALPVPSRLDCVTIASRSLLPRLSTMRKPSTWNLVSE